MSDGYLARRFRMALKKPTMTIGKAIPPDAWNVRQTYP
jgi:hypothetical protein